MPENYAEMASEPAIPGLDLTDAASYSPGGEDGGRAVTFGQADAHNSTLLPRTFRDTLDLGRRRGARRGRRSRSAPTTSRRGGTRTSSYRASTAARPSTRRRPPRASPRSPASRRRPTPPRSSASARAIADTLQITSGKTFPAGPDPAYAKAIDSTFDKLDKQVAKGRRALRREGAAFRAQAKAARDIQAAYGAAAKPLAARR